MSFKKKFVSLRNQFENFILKTFYRKKALSFQKRKTFVTNMLNN